MPRLPSRRAARVEQAAAEPVERERVHGAAQERPHGDERERDGRVVEQMPGHRRAEHARDPREPGDRGDRLLPASAASADSSRSETKTARGATSTAAARSHQLRSSADAGRPRCSRREGSLTPVTAVDRELTARVASVAPFTATLGIEMVSASPHEVRAQLEWREELCTAAGVLHGGALMGFADNVGGFCAFLNLPEGSGGTATIESKTNFFGPCATAWCTRSAGRCTRADGRSSSTRSSTTTTRSSSRG